jgi:hypothetical protein
VLLDTCLRVEIRPRYATYELLSGDSLTIHHHGEPVTLDGDEPRRLDIPHRSHPARYRGSHRPGAPATPVGGRTETAAGLVSR